MKKLLFLLLCLFVHNANAVEGFRISWTHANAYENGEVLKPEDRVRYNLYSRGINNSTPVLVAVIPGSANVYDYRPATLPKQSGNWCFNLTTTASNQMESKLSGTVCVPYKPTVAKPNQPTGFKTK